MLAIQLVAFVDDQLSVALCPSVMEVGVTEMFTVGDGGLVTSRAAVATKPPPGPLQVRVYVAVPAALGVTIVVPLVFCAPLQPLLAAQLVAFVDDQLSVALCPSVMEVGITEIFTVGDGELVTVKIAVATKPPPAPLHVRV